MGQRLYIMTYPLEYDCWDFAAGFLTAVTACCTWKIMLGFAEFWGLDNLWSGQVVGFTITWDTGLMDLFKSLGSGYLG